MAANATDLSRAGSFTHWEPVRMSERRPVRWLAGVLCLVHGLRAGERVDLLHRDGTISKNVRLGHVGRAGWANWFDDDHDHDIMGFKRAGVVFPGKPRVIVRG